MISIQFLNPDGEMSKPPETVNMRSKKKIKLQRICTRKIESTIEKFFFPTIFHPRIIRIPGMRTLWIPTPGVISE